MANAADLIHLLLHRNKMTEPHERQRCGYHQRKSHPSAESFALGGAGSRYLYIRLQGLVRSARSILLVLFEPVVYKSMVRLSDC